jgi:hypothetical protein
MTVGFHPGFFGRADELARHRQRIRIALDKRRGRGEPGAELIAFDDGRVALFAEFVYAILETSDLIRLIPHEGALRRRCLPARPRLHALFAFFRMFFRALLSLYGFSRIARLLLSAFFRLFYIPFQDIDGFEGIRPRGRDDRADCMGDFNPQSIRDGLQRFESRDVAVKKVIPRDVARLRVGFPSSSLESPNELRGGYKRLLCISESFDSGFLSKQSGFDEALSAPGEYYKLASRGASPRRVKVPVDIPLPVHRHVDVTHDTFKL